MTDEQTIKAMECCATDDGGDCSQCPYGNIVYKPGNGGCVNRCLKDALDLTNRQRAENESLQSRNKFLEIEYKNMSNLFQTRIQTSTTEAIKEFAERLKEYELCMFCSFPDNKSLGSEQYIVLSDSIDNLAKEMTEVQE